ncbi:MAG: hypothetical protein WCE82_12105 [Halobacteriota archaeon]
MIILLREWSGITLTDEHPPEVGIRVLRFDCKLCSAERLGAGPSGKT